MALPSSSRIWARPATAALTMTLSLACATLLTACAGQQNQAALVPADYRVAHPIVLHQGDRDLDVFTAGGAGAIGGRQIDEIHAFAAEYRGTGLGPLTIRVPVVGDGQAAVPAIRRALAEAGIPRPLVAPYHPNAPTAPAPVVLTFARLKASVASTCGQWPGDLNGSDVVDGWPNRPYANFGCATQSALADQVADPLDLERGRPETPAYAAKRMDTLSKFAKGEPTAVQYPDATKGSIGKVDQ